MNLYLPRMNYSLRIITITSSAPCHLRSHYYMKVDASFSWNEPEFVAKVRKRTVLQRVLIVTLQENGRRSQETPLYARTNQSKFPGFLEYLFCMVEMDHPAADGLLVLQFAHFQYAIWRRAGVCNMASIDAIFWFSFSMVCMVYLETSGKSFNLH